MLENNPDYAFTDSFAKIVGTHIGGSNKFVLMDNRRTNGDNQSQTLAMFWAGLWLSQYLRVERK
jgi:hypothetical protein